MNTLDDNQEEINLQSHDHEVQGFVVENLNAVWHPELKCILSEQGKILEFNAIYGSWPVLIPSIKSLPTFISTDVSEIALNIFLLKLNYSPAFVLDDQVFIRSDLIPLKYKSEIILHEIIERVLNGNDELCTQILQSLNLLNTEFVNDPAHTIATYFEYNFAYLNKHLADYVRFKCELHTQIVEQTTQFLKEAELLGINQDLIRRVGYTEKDLGRQNRLIEQVVNKLIQEK